MNADFRSCGNMTVDVPTVVSKLQYMMRRMDVAVVEQSSARVSLHSTQLSQLLG